MKHSVSLASAAVAESCCHSEPDVSRRVTSGEGGGGHHKEGFITEIFIGKDVCL